MLKKIVPVAAALALFMGGTVTPAQAATVKQGAACVKSGAKATNGKNSYVCQKNPTMASTKLVWITTDCIAASKTYLATKKDSDNFITQQTAALSKMKASIASWQNVVVLLDQKKAALETNLYPLWSDPTTHTMYKVQGITAAITQLTAKIAEVTAKRDNATAQSVKTNISATDKANWTKAATYYTQSISTYTKNRDNLTKVAPKIDSDKARAVTQITNMQTQLDASTAGQDALTAQVTAGATQALNYRTVACKAGI